MLKITFKGTLYTVEWDFNTKKTVTVATIRTKDMKIVGEGVARKYHSDEQDQVVGMKEALMKAANNADIHKNFPDAVTTAWQDGKIELV